MSFYGKEQTFGGQEDSSTNPLLLNWGYLWKIVEEVSTK
jgi:hypothetical protein